MYKPWIGLKELKMASAREASGIGRSKQSAWVLPRYYGKTLKASLMSRDPFYALHEVFTFVVTSELRFLITISTDLDMYFSSAEGVGNIFKCAASLKYYHRLLEQHWQQNEETLEWIKNRHLLDWPPSVDDDIALNAESRLKLDFDRLLRECKRLQKRCEEGISLAASRNAYGKNEVTNSEKHIGRRRSQLLAPSAFVLGLLLSWYCSRQCKPPG